jgi:hypothetical protein
MLTSTQCTINRVLASVIGGAYKANYFSVRSSDIDESGVRVTFDYLNYPYGLWSTPAPSALDEWVGAHATTLQSKDVDDAVSCMFEALPEDDTQEVITRSANGMKFELARSPRTNGDDVTESSYVFSIQLASASSQDAAAEDKVAAE